MGAGPFTGAYYGTSPAFSYFTGCSTSGRQGKAEAQRYPYDYDGIVAEAPAINRTRYVPTLCRLAAANAAVVAACDGLNGVTDGVIGNLGAYRFDPSTLGTATLCGTITAIDAQVIAIWRGARSRPPSSPSGSGSSCMHPCRTLVVQARCRTPGG